MLKPASPTPWSILKFAELIEDIVPPGMMNMVNSTGAEIGKALRQASGSPRSPSPASGHRAADPAPRRPQNMIPSTTGLGSKSPNIFFADVMAEDDEFLDKAVGALLSLSTGQVCACPSRR